MGLTKAIYIIAIAVFFVGITQLLQYKLDYDYVHDNMPMCEPEENERVRV